MTDKIKNILEQMTIEEKATMVCGASKTPAVASPSIGGIAACSTEDAYVPCG